MFREFSRSSKPVSAVQPDRLGAYVSLDRVGDEALLVGAVVHRLEFVVARLALAAELELGVESNNRDGNLAGLVFCQLTNCLIAIFLDHKAPLGRDVQE